jgi:hypothetical protein
VCARETEKINFEFGGCVNHFWFFRFFSERKKVERRN